MATFQLKLYKTKFRVGENAIYDELPSYLATCTQLTINDFQYLKPMNELTRTIKINMDQAYIAEGLKFGYDYLTCINGDTGNMFYYYITGNRWIAQKTIELDLSFDYLNSYRTAAESPFTNKTHITRRFKNRWEKIPSSGFYKPIVDKVPESINPPQLYLQSKTALTAEKDRWYLVYYSNNDSSDGTAANPIECMILPKGQRELDIEDKYVAIPGAGLAEGKYYYAFANKNPVFAYLKSEKQEGAYEGDAFASDDYPVIRFSRVYDGNTCKVQASVPVKTDTHSIWNVAWSSKTNEWVRFNQATYLIVSDSPNYIGASSSDEKLQLNAHFELSGTLTPFDTWYNLSKSLGIINKIIELPVAPFADKEVFTTVPPGWVADRFGFWKVLKRVDSTQSLGHQIIDNYSLPVKNLNEYDVKMPYNLQLETKLYHSAYFSVQYVYDSQSWTRMLEYDTNPITINFWAADEMSSMIVWKFDSQVPMTSLTSNLIISQRSLEVPIYTSAWLEYQRYGKEIDQRELGFNIAGTVVSGLGQSVNSGASLYAMSNLGSMSAQAKKITGGVGMAVNVATTAINAGLSIAKGLQSIADKESQMARTANQMSTTTELSILNTTLGNSLIRAIYEPDDYVKEAIANYFRLFGYATDEYGQMTNTRYWSDYFVAEVDWNESTNMLNPTVQDAITNAYKDGVRIYHYHEGYDLNHDYENWETSIKA